MPEPSFAPVSIPGRVDGTATVHDQAIARDEIVANQEQHGLGNGLWPAFPLCQRGLNGFWIECA